MRRAALAALAGAGVALGLVAERQGYAWSDLRGWLPDLLAGWTLIGLGLALIALQRPRGAAVLLLAAGFSWFAFNFATSGPAAVGWIAVHAAYLHRAPLFALALALPDGRPRTRLATGTVAMAWVAAVAWPLWDDDMSALVLAAAFLAVAVAGLMRATGRRGRALAGRGLVAVAVLAAAISADALRSLAGTSQDVTDLTVLGYDCAVVVAGAALFSAALLAAPSSLTNRAVALERGGARLRDALRELLGDPRLELGFAACGPRLALGDTALVDDLGRPLGPPAEGQAVTPVLVAGRQAGVVVHDPGTLDDHATRAAVVAVAGLAAERARLRAEVGRRIGEVEASRRRLLLAEDEERRSLAARLDRGPGAALADVERLVREARVAGDGPLAAALDRAGDQLGRIRPELDALVRGLGGIDTAGLVAALERLAAGLPLETELRLDDVDMPAEVASALWFVCAESLANVVRHAEAGSVAIRLAGKSGLVRLSVEDDGRGGADPGGSGLVGLADRVAALGGRLTIASPAGSGTRVTAELPLP